MENGEANGQGAAQAGQRMDPMQQLVSQLDTEGQNRRKHEQETTSRQVADTQAKKVVKCDGSDCQAVREWIKDVDLTTYYSQRTVYIAAQSSYGQLRRELERYLNAQADRLLVTWDQLKKHLQDAFISSIEDEQLRYRITQIAQKFGEKLACYNRRFSELADEAYPIPAGGARNDDQQRILLQNYIRGIEEDSVANRVITDGHPKTLEEAQKFALTVEADEFQVNTARKYRRAASTARHEEPMEIGAVDQRRGGASQDQGAAWQAPFDVLTRKVDGLSKQLTRLVSVLDREGLPARQDSTRRPVYEGPAWTQDLSAKMQTTPDGPIVCHYCHKMGHTLQQCRKKQRADQRRGGANQNQGGR